MPPVTAWLFLALVYLATAVPFGLLVSTVFGSGDDVRKAGSGNIGTTNVFRTQGPVVAVLVLALDVAKGAVPVLVGRLLWAEGGLGWDAAVAMTAFTGHCLPVYLTFRGGKGVATGAGVMLAIAPGPALIAVLVWIGLLVLLGRSSVASLVAAGAMVVAVVLLQPAVLPVAGLLAVGVGATHTGNLRRLVDGTEAPVITPIRRGGVPAAADPAELLRRGPAGAGATPAGWGREE